MDHVKVPIFPDFVDNSPEFLNTFLFCENYFHMICIRPSAPDDIEYEREFLFNNKKYFC